MMTNAIVYDTLGDMYWPVSWPGPVIDHSFEIAEPVVVAELAVLRQYRVAPPRTELPLQWIARMDEAEALVLYVTNRWLHVGAYEDFLLNARGMRDNLPPSLRQWLGQEAVDAYNRLIASVEQLVRSCGLRFDPDAGRLVVVAT
jgi:hypothetical protein